MIPILSLLLILYISLFITRLATIALVHTGLSKQEARFQARSAFTGCGFTTSEAEKMVTHPVRRKIVMWLMLYGHVGLVTMLSTAVLGFIDTDDKTHELLVRKLLVLTIGLVILWFITANRWVDHYLSLLIDWGLKRYTSLAVKDYVHLFHLSDGYRIVELNVCENDWLNGKTLQELALMDEGLLVLGICRKNGVYIGAPRGKTKIGQDDVLIIYGQQDLIDSIDRRESGEAGDREHVLAKAQQDRILEEEQDRDEDASHQS